MALDVGRLVAYLEVDDSKYNEGMDQAESRFGRLSSFMSGAVKAVAGAALAGGAVVVGLGVKAIKTGVAYNALQQASRAALTTILGGSKAANAQMDKLDAFAKNSPFAKQVFIQAQQQLLGFGVEAKRVIPTLSAVQDAVAAVGGSSDDVGKITYALAQIKGQGKLTGETLNQLGQYGIDAASIIGKQMGLTGAQVRDMASKPGGIPADKVFNPLVDGLEKKFGGAAANVKTTWAGATDRIKAAFRDIGSALVEPFIGHKGGGLAIDWANQLATRMRTMIPLATKLSTNVAHLLSGLGGNPKSGPIDHWVIAGMKARAILDQIKARVVGMFPSAGAGGGIDFAATWNKIADAARRAWPEIQHGAEQVHGLVPIVKLAGAAAQFLYDHLDTVVKVLPIIIAAWAAYRITQQLATIASLAHIPASLANSAAMFAAARANNALAAAISEQTAIQNGSIISTQRSTIGIIASKVAQLATAAATKAWAAAQWLINAALTANPIGIVVVAVAALVAGLILAYKHSDKFRAIVQTMGKVVIGIFKSIASFFLLIVSSILTGLSKLLAPLALLPGKFGAPFRAAKEAVDKARGAVDDLRHSINETKGKNVKVTVSLPGGSDAVQKLADLRWQIDHIPRSVTVGVNSKLHAMGSAAFNAKGTPSFRGGLSWVGEEGPELVDLPAGTAIHSHPKSMAMMEKYGATQSRPAVEVHGDVITTTPARFFAEAKVQQRLDAALHPAF